MKNFKIFYSLITLFVVASISVLATSCTKDEEPACGVTFENEVYAIMLNSCAYAGCHSGATASPYVPASAKDFTSFEGLMETVENGKFALRAIEQLNMPPVTFVPPGKPATLNQEEIDALQCWLDSGHPEK